MSNTQNRRLRNGVSIGSRLIIYPLQSSWVPNIILNKSKKELKATIISSVVTGCLYFIVSYAVNYYCNINIRDVLNWPFLYLLLSSIFAVIKYIIKIMILSVEEPVIVFNSEYDKFPLWGLPLIETRASETPSSPEDQVPSLSHGGRTDTTTEVSLGSQQSVSSSEVSVNSEINWRNKKFFDTTCTTEVTPKNPMADQIIEIKLSVLSTLHTLHQDDLNEWEWAQLDNASNQIRKQRLAQKSSTCLFMHGQHTVKDILEQGTGTSFTKDSATGRELDNRKINDYQLRVCSGELSLPEPQSSKLKKVNELITKDPKAYFTYIPNHDWGGSKEI